MNEVKTMIPIPCFNYRIYLIFTDDLTSSANKLVKDGILKDNHCVDDATDGFTVRMPNQSCTYVVLDFKSPINHITHECYHAVTNMFNWISATHEEEVFAYMMGYINGLIVHDQEKAQKKLEKLLTKQKNNDIMDT